MVTTLIETLGTENLILSAVFAATTMLFLVGVFVMRPAIETRRRLHQELIAEGHTDRRSLAAQSELARLAARRPIEAYFQAAESERDEPDALASKLFRAGFYSSYASFLYTLIRIGCVVGGFLGALALLGAVVPSTIPGFLVYLTAGLVGLGCMVVPSIALDFFERGQKEKFRRGFPDFMDMMVTCADAGLSLEASVERVSRELAATHRELGVHLSIMALQMRAGKPMRQALMDLSNRIGIEEARSLAILFSQSEELGASLTEALRIYSDEMRMQRILRAEEKANALPVKMMIPLGLCVFPVVLMIIMLPAILRMRGVFF